MVSKMTDKIEDSANAVDRAIRLDVHFVRSFETVLFAELKVNQRTARRFAVGYPLRASRSRAIVRT